MIENNKIYCPSCGAETFIKNLEKIEKQKIINNLIKIKILERELECQRGIINEMEKEKQTIKINKEKENKNIKDNIKETREEKEKRPESNKVRYLMQLKKEKEIKDNKPKQGKYSKYKKIVIESIDKPPEQQEKKMGKIYTTYKPPMQRRPSTKEKNNLVKQNRI